VVDRLKELIKVSGYQVAPAELEVIRRRDERHGEVPVAVVVAIGPVDEAALIAWAAERSAPYKRLHAVRFADAIPRTPSGKILRRVLAEREPAMVG
jgi:acyl-CoA synthetase (AMP-forming)/AMP-acid ligase II